MSFIPSSTSQQLRSVLYIVTQSGSAIINSFKMQKDMPERRGTAVARDGPKEARSSSLVGYPTTAGELEHWNNSRGTARDYPLMHSEIKQRVERLQQLGSDSAVLPMPSDSTTEERSTSGMPEKKDEEAENLVSKPIVPIKARPSLKAVRFSTAAPEVVEFEVVDASPYRRRDRTYKDNFRLRGEPKEQAPPVEAPPTKKFTSLDQLMANFKNKSQPSASK